MKFLNEFLCLWLAQMRHEKGTCTASVLVRRAHVMVPVHGWQSVGILGHGCQAASLYRHTLLPLKIALQRRGGCTEGLTFVTTHSLATQEVLRLRIGAKNCPPERRGWWWRGRGERGEEDARGYGGNARVQSQAYISHIHAGYVCMNMCIYECFLYITVCVRRGSYRFSAGVCIQQHSMPNQFIKLLCDTLRRTVCAHIIYP